MRLDGTPNTTPLDDASGRCLRINIRMFIASLLRTLRVVIALVILTGSQCILSVEGTDPYPSEFYEQSSAAERPSMPWFGAGLTTTTPEAQRRNHTRADQGVLVTRVYPNTTASEMGVQAGDLIVNVNGSNITGARVAGGSIGRLSSGDEIQVNIIRDGVEQKLNGTMRTAAESYISGMTPKQRLAYFREKREERLMERMLVHISKQGRKGLREKLIASDQRRAAVDKVRDNPLLIKNRDHKHFSIEFSYEFDSDEM